MLAYFLLGERLKRPDQIALIFVVACVCLVMLGAKPSSGSTHQLTSEMLPLVALLSQPLLLAAGMIAMR
jgi:drug/metabolite transporter (DMT)-like permease